jgi:hypothetical protein
VANDRTSQQLIAGLTPGQLAELVGRLLGRMSEAERDAFCGTLEADVAAVVRRALAPPLAGGTAAKETGGEKTSDAKFADRFHSVLGALEERISEVGDEEGDYAYQEHDWEPPDFDAGRLSDDLERCAKDLLPLLERAAALGLADEDLFVDLCHDITDGLGQYPDHIYTGDGVGFGPKATECMLRWLDLHVQTEAGFLELLLATIEGSGSVSFERGTIRAYLIEGWPETRRRALYRAIEERRVTDAGFREETDAAKTLWHDIRYALAAAFDAVAGTAIAEASVSDDWELGVELVDAALAQGNSVRAIEFCRKTLDAYYRQRFRGSRAAGFEPGATPMFSYWGVHDESPRITRMLDLWAELAAKAGDQRLAGLLTVQQALFTRADDWTAVRAAFARAAAADTSVLFRAWKEQVLRQQHDAWVSDAPQGHPAWVEWLIDAGFAGRFDTFTDKALQWLGETLEAERRTGHDVFRYVPGHVWPPQMSLVAELFALSTSSGEYPTLRAMLAKYCRLNPCPCPARLEWLGQADVARLTPVGVEFVRRNMARLIPSPGTQGDYQASAGWLAVAREVAPDMARRTLQHWQVEHRRRRNLWRDLREHGIEVGTGG